MSSLSSISSLSGLPSPANSTRSRSDNLRQNLTHTIGKNGGKGRNVITTKSVFRPDLSVSAHWHFHAGPGHGTRSHASPSTGSSSHDHRQDNSGTRRGGRNSYSSLPPRSYSSQRRPSSPSSSSCNEAPFQALRTCPQVPVPPSPSSPPPPSPAPRTPRTPRRVHHDYAFLEPSSSVASSYSRTSCPHPASGQTSSPSPRSKSKANSHRCVQSFASLFISLSGPIPADFHLHLFANSIHILCLPILPANDPRVSRIGYMHSPASSNAVVTFGVCFYVRALAPIVTFATTH